jgi:hypothetical protein
MPPAMSDTKQTMSFRISSPLIAMLKDAAHRNNVTVSSYIEAAIKQQIGSIVDQVKDSERKPTILKFQGGSITLPHTVKVPHTGLLILDPKLSK